nr:hypothetical protein YSBCXYJI_YSBCXYJI_CDS_0079 [Caudoviricetes sp.]
MQMKIIREKATGFYSVWDGESKYAIIGKPEDLAKRKVISPEEAIIHVGKWLAVIESLDNAVIVFDTLRDAKIHYSKLKES